MSEKKSEMKVHPYLPHLLSDIVAAHREDLPMEFISPEEEDEDHFEEVERFLSGDLAEHSFGYYCGLEKINFPPPGIFSEGEMLMVCTAMEKMMSTWNAGIDLPENLPIAFRYELTVGVLEEGFTLMNFGHVTFDFCTGYAPDCKLKEFCPCIKFWSELEEGEETEEFPE